MFQVSESGARTTASVECFNTTVDQNVSLRNQLVLNFENSAQPFVVHEEAKLVFLNYVWSRSL